MEAVHAITGIPVAGSFRDPSGFLFRRDGVLYRHVAPIYRPHYERLHESGLYTELTRAGLLLAHEEVSASLSPLPGALSVLRPRELPFISYPYEWCFGELRDAALLTLDVQRRALCHGLTLKDASAYNVQFDGGRPVFIDSLSFETRPEGAPWLPYRQFCQHFLAPLAVMAYVDVRLQALLRQYLDGLPLDLTSALLPRRTWLRFGMMLHLHLHARSLRYFCRRSLGASCLSTPVSLTSQLGLVESLAAAIQRLRWQPRDTTWARYEREPPYDPEAREAKHRAVASWIGQVKPRTVWDLGANTGEYSRLAASAGASVVVALDADPTAVEKNYQTVVQRHESRILPLLGDLTNPSPDQGWGHEERMSLAARRHADMALALALVHHLAISNNTPLARLADYFGRLARWLIVEWVPKSDPQVRRLLGARQDIFTDYDRQNFERAFATQFRIIMMEPLPRSERVLYLMERVHEAVSGQAWRP